MQRIVYAVITNAAFIAFLGGFFSFKSQKPVHKINGKEQSNDKHERKWRNPEQTCQWQKTLIYCFMTRLALFLINQNTSVAKGYSYSPIFTPQNAHIHTVHTLCSVVYKWANSWWVLSGPQRANKFRSVLSLHHPYVRRTHADRILCPFLLFQSENPSSWPFMHCGTARKRARTHTPLLIQTKTKPNPSFSWVYSVVSTCCITTKYFFPLWSSVPSGL